MAKKKLNTTGLIDEAAERVGDLDPSPAASRHDRAPLKLEKRTRAATEQMNFRVSEGLGRDIKRWALDHDVAPADVIEAGFEMVKAKFGP